MSRAVSSSTSSAIRTRSKADPGLLSIDVLISAISIADERGQPADDLLAALAGQIRRSDLHGERRDIGDQQATVPVVDEPAGRWDGLQDGPVLGRERRELGPARDLEVEQSRGQSTDRDQRDQPKTRKRESRRAGSTRPSRYPFTSPPVPASRDGRGSRRRAARSGWPGRCRRSRSGGRSRSGSATGSGEPRAPKATNNTIEYRRLRTATAMIGEIGRTRTNARPSRKAAPMQSRSAKDVDPMVDVPEHQVPTRRRRPIPGQLQVRRRS